MAEQPEMSMEQVIRQDGRYPPEAYEFLHAGLNKAVKSAPDDEDKPSDPPGQHHVSGRDMCMSLRDLAIERWGLLAKTVLTKWNIHATIDFGQMVYLLIHHQFMRKTDEDSLDDFRDVYAFDDAFNGADHFELSE